MMLRCTILEEGASLIDNMYHLEEGCATWEMNAPLWKLDTSSLEQGAQFIFYMCHLDTDRIYAKQINLKPLSSHAT